MSHWLAFAIYVFITAITPGPNNLLSLTEGAKKGFRQALPLNFGILAGFLIVMLICTVLTATVSEWIPVLMTPMQILGALYILWLAWQTFRSSSGDWESGLKEKALTVLFDRVSAAVCQRQNLHLRHYVNAGLCFATFQRTVFDSKCVCLFLSFCRLCLHAFMVGFWLCIPIPFLNAR